MHVVCPSCCERFPLAAGLADEEGKRLALLFAGMQPVLGRAVIGYLRLFKPARQALRTARAVRIVEELVSLVDAGQVTRDERSGQYRPATPALWAAGIEQMLAAPGKLALPIANHNYLRAIVWALAEQADAAAERQREADRRVGAHRQPASAGAASENPAINKLRWLQQQRGYGALTQEEYDAQVASMQLRGQS